MVGAHLQCVLSAFTHVVNVAWAVPVLLVVEVAAVEDQHELSAQMSMWRMGHAFLEAHEAGIEPRDRRTALKNETA